MSKPQIHSQGVVLKVNGVNGVSEGDRLIFLTSMITKWDADEESKYHGVLTESAIVCAVDE
jgi:hypothetical protein